MTLVWGSVLQLSLPFLIQNVFVCPKFPKYIGLLLKNKPRIHIFNKMSLISGINLIVSQKYSRHMNSTLSNQYYHNQRRIHLFELSLL